MAERVLFGRVGWMKLYKGPQLDDEKPISGGKYNKAAVGHEAFNFLPIKDRVFGYFQPQLQPKNRRKLHPSKINLGRIEPGFKSGTLDDVLVIFLARDPRRGGQRIVGWYKNAKVHRSPLRSPSKERDFFWYFVEADANNATLVPSARRRFVVPGGKGGIGQTNICYPLDAKGRPKANVRWIRDAVDYVRSYQQEDAAQQPTSETDSDIAELLGNTIERAAGYQSNPRIRRAIEDYAMQWAFKRLSKEGWKPVDTHKTKSYDFLCKIADQDVYVEVKGTQDNGKSVSLTPKEVEHAQKHKNSALFVVHSVNV